MRTNVSNQLPKRTRCLGRAGACDLATTKGGNIGAARQVDNDRIIGSGGGVITLNRPAESRRFDPNDRIKLRIEFDVAPEHLHSNRVGLDAVLLAVQRGFDDVTQESHELGR